MSPNEGLADRPAPELQSLYHCVIVGGGPAGPTCAIAAAAINKSLHGAGAENPSRPGAPWMRRN